MYYLCIIYYLSMHLLYQTNIVLICILTHTYPHKSLRYI